MKESGDNLSWDDISKSLNREKNDTKSRWKLIRHQRTRQPASQSSVDEDGVNDPGQSEEDEAKTTHGKNLVRSTCVVATKKMANQEPGSHVAKGTRHGQPHDSANTQSNDDVLSGNGASDESSCGTNEHSHELEYLYGEMFNSIYPVETEYEANEYLSEWDTAMLATIACMHTQNKLLEMKANFMNATGADVPIAVLRDWYEGGWAAKHDYRPCLNQEISDERVEEWIDSVSMEEK